MTAQRRARDASRPPPPRAPTSRAGATACVRASSRRASTPCSPSSTVRVSPAAWWPCCAAARSFTSRRTASPTSRATCRSTPAPCSVWARPPSIWRPPRSCCSRIAACSRSTTTCGGSCPSCPTSAPTITLRHLLTMTSGIPDGLTRLLFAGHSARHPIAQSSLVELFRRGRGLLFQPGEQCSYSNTNYSLLAMVLERLTGATLRDFLRREFFAPFGMTRDRPGSRRARSGAGLGTRLRAGRREHADRRPRPRAPTRSFFPVELSADGGVNATLDDLVRWLQHLRLSDGPVRRWRQRLEQEGVLDERRAHRLRPRLRGRRASRSAQGGTRRWHAGLSLRPRAVRGSERPARARHRLRRAVELAGSDAVRVGGARRRSGARGGRMDGNRVERRRAGRDRDPGRSAFGYSTPASRPASCSPSWSGTDRRSASTSASRLRWWSTATARSTGPSAASVSRCVQRRAVRSRARSKRASERARRGSSNRSRPRPP